MCGIAGVIGHALPDLEPRLEAMALALVHRGPDAGGIWTDAAGGIGLAHRRLSILDLSPQGAQPMASACGRFVLCYNGEIYNHGDLRRELDAYHPSCWRGHSDTEVLVEAIATWGVDRALTRCNGMFAFAVWDRAERRLTLARDRMGEKPLYVGRVGGVIAFASEIKALRELPGWQQTVDTEALSELLRYGYVPAPRSIHSGIFKLPAAATVSFTPDDAAAPLGREDFVARVRHYWGLAAVAAAGVSDPFAVDADAAASALEPLLADAVARRMEADVPVGALLSGGVDSSLVAALMQRTASRPIRTFTIGFDDARFDEARHARRVAEHLGTDHTELHLTPDQALDVIPQLPQVYDEPFADASQIPTLLVSAIAREHVTVALSGDGGDELFFGYGRYRDALAIWDRIGGWTPGLRRGVAAGLGGAGRMVGGNLGFRLRRLGRRIDAADFDAYYANLLSVALEPTAASIWPQGLPGALVFPAALADPSMRMMFADQQAYLPDDILVKTDRASMAASLELRVPLLDHRIVEFAWRLPDGCRRDGATGKAVLRRLLYRHVPREIVDRPKQGFEIPVDDWLRGPLRTWMLDLLDPSVLRREGLINAKAVSVLVADHLAGRGRNGFALWPLLMFEAWRRRFG
ncbi:asparagine synthase (glutamine-hydrolyzing) [Stagnimonas aquatica]|uniref:asparagine synthase (glutamine-hydrolyzing) n=1 Tax=Stagnimonas aquatica TaxID=2689987 RepID=A0A3N0VKV5_9GAMM|nr:asparagine synthase (glutamine-hydrolyzing) [Stagnimonas aquatica]ROH93397.1 asparagine synthase (glutamine-hydrolyzing) [Stagnimonas aquatica]